MKKTTTVEMMLVNRYGITVKRCCASCQHKRYDDFGCRKCDLTKRKVRGRYRCDNWELSEQLESIGCERGHVQRRTYQLTLMDLRATESTKPIEVIRREFEEEQGSRFEF